jgi:hypothetical protein
MTIKTFCCIINVAFIALLLALGVINYEVVTGQSHANIGMAYGLTVFFGLMLVIIKKIAVSCEKK